MNYVRERICPKCGNKMIFECSEDEGFERKNGTLRWYVVESWECYHRGCFCWEEVRCNFEFVDEKVIGTSEEEEI